MAAGWRTSQSKSGRMEVFVRPFPEGDQRIQVSTGGGETAGLVEKQRDLLHREAAAFRRLPSRPQGGSLSVSKPVVLFPTAGDTHLVSAFDVTPDGQRFLMLRSRGSQHLALIFNWPSDLARIGAPGASSDR